MSGSNPAPYDTYETWEFSYDLEGKLNIALVDSEHELDSTAIEMPTFLRSINLINGKPGDTWIAAYLYHDNGGEKQALDLYFDWTAQKWAIARRFDGYATHQPDEVMGRYPSVYAAITAYSDLLSLAFNPMDLCVYRSVRAEPEAAKPTVAKTPTPKPETYGTWS